MRLEYVVSSRNLMGFKGELMTMTKGLGMMHHSFHGYGPKGADPATAQQKRNEHTEKKKAGKPAAKK